MISGDARGTRVGSVLLAARTARWWPRLRPAGRRTASQPTTWAWLGLLSIATWSTLVLADAPPPATDPTATPSAAPTLPPDIEPTAAIDRLLEISWQSSNVTPSSLCSDAAFARRVTLDLIGRIPTRSELQAFLTAPTGPQRDALIDQLLSSPEHARHLADLFDTMLLGRPLERAGGRRKSMTADRSTWRQYLTESFATNRPWNRMARDMTLARASHDTDVRGGFYLYDRFDDYQAIAESVGPSFFGVRIECAQCHDHPLAGEILQSHYWGLVAFFNRGKNQDTERGPRVVESAQGGFQKYTDLAGDSFETQLTFYRGPVINEARPPEGTVESDADYVLGENGEPRRPKFSRREQFVDRLLSEHPLVAPAFVNRIWALLMGRGIVHPYDRMDSVHPASQPELLTWLADDFRRSGYDVQRLIRAIVRSRAYQLDSRPTSPQVLPQHFAHALTKPLTGESLLRSAYVVATDAATEPPAELMKEFGKQFPDLLAEENTTNVSAALLLTNHAAFNALWNGPEAVAVNQLAAGTDVNLIVTEAFLQVLGREAEADEQAAAASFVQSHAATADGARQLIWALVTSAEFRFNH